MGRLVLLSSMALAAIVAFAASAQEVGQPAQGQTLARQICAECHAVTKGAAASPNPRAPAFEALASTPGMTRAALFAALQTSHRTMPNLVLQGDDMANVVAYILSLKSGS
jgi:mono/diheme cytochrome c family protein